MWVGVPPCCRQGGGIVLWWWTITITRVWMMWRRVIFIPPCWCRRRVECCISAGMGRVDPRNRDG